MALTQSEVKEAAAYVVREFLDVDIEYSDVVEFLDGSSFEDLTGDDTDRVFVYANAMLGEFRNRVSE